MKSFVAFSVDESTDKMLLNWKHCGVDETLTVTDKFLKLVPKTIENDIFTLEHCTVPDFRSRLNIV